MCLTQPKGEFSQCGDQRLIPKPGAHTQPWDRRCSVLPQSPEGSSRPRAEQRKDPNWVLLPCAPGVCGN